MNKKTYILALIVGALVVAGFVFFQKDTSQTITQTETQNTSEANDQSSASSTKEEVIETEKEVSEPIDTVVASDKYEGVHIMADGAIMAKDGTRITGAKILTNGKIQLSDGTIITPAFDLRTGAAKQNVTAPAGAHVTVDITGTDFAYDKKQIKVKKGDTVTVNFKSDEGFHDFVIDELNVATERVDEGEGVTSVTFVADKTGTFQYYCSVMSHRQMGMVGYLIVE